MTEPMNDEVIPATPGPVVTNRVETGLIDRDVVQQDPVYTHAGTLGSQNVMECGSCGALIREAFIRNHSTLHSRLDGISRYTGAGRG